MKRYAFVDSSGNINSIFGWGDNRDLPEEYPIPDGCIVKEIDDDMIDNLYIYDNSTDTFIINPNPPTPEAVNNTTIKDLQQQIFDLTTLLVQGGAL